MFKSFGEWLKAYHKTLDENNIKGKTHGIGDDGIFFLFDYNHHDTLWTYDKYGALKKYKRAD